MCIETPTAPPPYATCSDACASIGKTCTTTYCYGSSGKAQGGYNEANCAGLTLEVDSCTDAITWYSGVNGLLSIGCCCE
jgi:hypothetical protein